VLLFAKIVVSAVVFLAVYFFSFWVVFAQIFSLREENVPNILALVTAAVAAFWVWRSMGAADQGILATAAIWAAVAGALGFCGGFFGPLIFMPQANQGPLLGIFLTGPLGFIGGGLCGTVYAFWRRAKRRSVS
jgi:hypothetical protein